MSRYMGGSKNGGVDWDYYSTTWNIDKVNDKYLPARGEGNTMATQICTAINKLIYKWYNDGDVFDNQHNLDGFGNDLSSYANWLALYVDGAKETLDRIKTINTQGEYEMLLCDLSGYLDEEILDKYNEQPAIGSIYDCDGEYKFVEEDDDEDDNEEDE